MKSTHRNCSVEQLMTDRIKDYYLFLINPRMLFENASISLTLQKEEWRHKLPEPL